MTTKAAAAKTERSVRKLKRGDLVELRWKDSGRTASSRKTSLSTRLAYGRVHAVGDDSVVIAMDVDEEDEDAEAGNEWGILWISAILRVEKLFRESELG